MKLNFRKEGAGRPVIILHGLFGASDNWLTISKKLGDRFTIYLPDLRNHGSSPHSEVFDYQAMTEDLRELIEENGLGQPAVVGHSMGGKAAMALASAYPKLVRQLVVVDIAPRAYPVHHQTILQAYHSVPLDTLTSRKEAEDIMARLIPDMGTRQFLLKNLGRDAEGRFSWKMNLPVITEKIAEVVAEIRFEQPFTAPALFIRGDRSDYIREADRAEITRSFPNSSLLTVSNAGHWVHAEQPEVVYRALLDFLGE